MIHFLGYSSCKRSAFLQIRDHQCLFKIQIGKPLKNQHSPQVDRWLRGVELDENGFLSEENFEEGVRRTRINTDLYVRLVAKDNSFRYMGLNTFKSIVRGESWNLWTRWNIVYDKWCLAALRRGQNKLINTDLYERQTLSKGYKTLFIITQMSFSNVS